MLRLQTELSVSESLVTCLKSPVIFARSGLGTQIKNLSSPILSFVLISNLDINQQLGPEFCQFVNICVVPGF